MTVISSEKALNSSEKRKLPSDLSHASCIHLFSALCRIISSSLCFLPHSFVFPCISSLLPCATFSPPLSLTPAPTIHTCSKLPHGNYDHCFHFPVLWFLYFSHNLPVHHFPDILITFPFLVPASWFPHVSILDLCLLLRLCFSCGLTSSLEIQDDLHHSNQSYTELSDGNTTSYNRSDNNNQTSNERPDETETTCTYWDVVEYLNLTENKDKFTMIRPTSDYKSETLVYIEMRMYAILDVREADQSFISYIWIYMEWENDFLSWDEEDFCGISEVVIPRESLWMPDVIIEEMTEKDKNLPSPFVTLSESGWVVYRDDEFVISTCKMKIFNFPFDIQSCSITFRSLSYSEKDLTFVMKNNDALITKDSQKNIRMQYEWEFLSMSGTRKPVQNFYTNQTVVVYTITMKRKSALYVVNFLLPVLFFLCLDFASLLMSAGSADKISFKITVLLAVTVMQLILIEILPFTSSKIPLIVIYCIGIFALMLLGLLETIFLNYLMGKDSSSLESKKESDKLQIIKASSTASTCDELTDQTASTCKGGSSSQLFLAMEKVSDELGEMKKTFLDKESEENKDGYWTRVAKKIDKIFSILYVLAAILFLSVVFSVWLSKSDSLE
ncbi:5-hydroxytryptamine receptor 3A-like [Poecilia latipinna]|uniref:5-hydroxytryptamine receptor 3A-like n=1 Tax=Poecilia latipinna TaxID=48699 RepID=UPI00072E8DF7|nr:PREDICTED: 5-hydroxytryptamine receptor 3A-like [Poecilia latipinna]